MSPFQMGVEGKSTGDTGIDNIRHFAAGNRPVSVGASGA